jgi:hypothetical protein
MIAFALYAAACFAGMTAVMYGSAMAARWLDARDAGEIAQGSIVEALEELREAGGKAWDQVADVEAELGRKPAVGPATRDALKVIEYKLRSNMDLIAANGTVFVPVEIDDPKAFLAELEADA